MHDFLVELVGALAALLVVGIAGGISLAIRTRGALSDCAGRISHAEQDIESLSVEIEKVEKKGRDGRDKLFARMDEQEADIANSVRHLETTLSARLEGIAKMITDFSTAQAELSARVEIMDTRGTRYLQESHDRGRRE